MQKLIICLLLVILVCIPAASAVSAGNYTTLNVWTAGSDSMTFSDVSIVSFNSIEDADVSAVSEIEFSGVKPGTYDLILTQANGIVHTGQIIYESSGLLGTSGNWTLTLDGYSHSWSGLNVEPLGKLYIGTYAENIDTEEKGLILVDGWIGNTIIGTVTGEYNCVFSPVSTIEAYPITQVEIQGTDTFSVMISYGDYKTVSEEIGDSDLSVWDWIGNLFSFVGNVGGILFAIMAAFKFIVVDHFFALVVLYESLIMAYAASNSRDIFTFCKKLFRYNKSLFTAILGFIQVVVDIFHRLIDALKFW